MAVRNRVVITGASGFVGRQLVSRLARRGYELLLAGRDATLLRRMYAKHGVCDYRELPDQVQVGDVFIHLATLNNTANQPEQTFKEVNVRLLNQCACLAKAGGASLFVNFSSTHALNERDKSEYARSKRLGIEQLRELKGLAVANLYLATVWGDWWMGRLSFLNLLPRSLAALIFPAIAAIKPTLHIDKLEKRVIGIIEEQKPGDFILTDGQRNNLFFRATSRAIDLCFALTVLVCFWWLFLVLWVLIRLESTGPGFFIQDRVGLDGKTFKCYKFRTMRTGTVQAGTHEVSEDVITNVGRVLRGTKLDELPQVLNILKNEIALVGPRPCLPQQSLLVRLRRSRGVLTVKPGITGWAQVHGVDMSNPEKLVEWDAEYLATRSLLMDLSIVISTALGRGQGDRISDPKRLSLKKAA